MTTLRLGAVGEVTAPTFITCNRCCYNYDIKSDEMPYVNGTHFINGTDIFPGAYISVGFAFGTDGRVILPCAINTHTSVVYYKSSSPATVNPKLYLFVMGLITSVLYKK
ncbi:hypothetical protein FBU30_000633 [Linnemannia zychae]|nr:hypothetical protein FBU30_000633 [Linnemannia zychae]